MNLSCHCGNVKITAEKPETLTSCNCSMCHRYGSLWGYYSPSDIIIEVESAETQSYRWGDEDLDFHRCPTCGCVLYWLGLNTDAPPRIALNFRMASHKEIEPIPVKKFDGADTWQFIE